MCVSVEKIRVKDSRFLDGLEIARILSECGPFVSRAISYES